MKVLEEGSVERETRHQQTRHNAQNAEQKCTDLEVELVALKAKLLDEADMESQIQVGYN